MLAPWDLWICFWNRVQLYCKMAAQRTQVSSPLRRQIDTSITCTDRYSYNKGLLVYPTYIMFLYYNAIQPTGRK